MATRYNQQAFTVALLAGGYLLSQVGTALLWFLEHGEGVFGLVEFLWSVLWVVWRLATAAISVLGHLNAAVPIVVRLGLATTALDAIDSTLLGWHGLAVGPGLYRRLLSPDGPTVLSALLYLGACRTLGWHWPLWWTAAVAVAAMSWAVAFAGPAGCGVAMLLLPWHPPWSPDSQDVFRQRIAALQERRWCHPPRCKEGDGNKNNNNNTAVINNNTNNTNTNTNNTNNNHPNHPNNTAVTSDQTFATGAGAFRRDRACIASTAAAAAYLAAQLVLGLTGWHDRWVCWLIQSAIALEAFGSAYSWVSRSRRVRFVAKVPWSAADLEWYGTQTDGAAAAKAEIVRQLQTMCGHVPPIDPAVIALAAPTRFGDTDVGRCGLCRCHVQYSPRACGYCDSLTGTDPVVPGTKSPAEKFAHGIAPNATTAFRWLRRELAGSPGYGLVPALGHRLHRRTGHQMLEERELLSLARAHGFHVDLEVSVPVTIRVHTLAGDSVTTGTLPPELTGHTVGQLVRRVLTGGALAGLCNDEIAQAVVGDFEEDARELQVTVGHVLPAVPVLVAHDRQSLEITVAVALAPTRPLRVFIERRDTAAADAAAAAAGDPPADADTVELEVPIACSIAGLQHLVATSTGIAPDLGVLWTGAAGSDAQPRKLAKLLDGPKRWTTPHTVVMLPDGAPGSIEFVDTRKSQRSRRGDVTPGSQQVRIGPGAFLILEETRPSGKQSSRSPGRSSLLSWLNPFAGAGTGGSAGTDALLADTVGSPRSRRPLAARLFSSKKSKAKGD